MVQVTVGVDTGKARHQAAAYDPAAERIVGQVSFSVDRAGFDHVRGFLERLRPQPDQVVIGPEATGQYHLTLVEYLVSLGYRVALLNPLRAAQFRRSQGKRAKTDRLDAQALARFLAVRAPRPQPVPSQALVELRELTRFRAELVGQRTTVLHQLIGAVDLAFPELPHLLGDLRGRTGLALLARYPSASAIATADPQRLTELLHQASRGHFGPTRVARLLATARARVAVRQTAEVLGLKIRSLVRQLTLLDQEIADLDDAIAEHFGQLGYRPADFPVGGVVALATLVAEAGPLDRYPTAKHFVAYFGWCPVDSQSGSYKDPHPRLSQAGNRYVRRIIWMLAIHAVSRPGPYRDCFLRRTAAGKHKMDSVVAVGRKLLATVYAILKSGRPYDPTFRFRDADQLATAA
jgi:transposase